MVFSEICSRADNNIHFPWAHKVLSEVYSQEGKLIMRKLKSDFIDLSSLVNGLYYLSLRNKQGIQQVPIVRISN